MMNANIWISRTEEPSSLYKYNNVNYNNTIWYLIGKKVKLPPAVCERQWESIERAFQKLYKECYPERSYKFDDRLRFLMHLFNNENESEITSTNDKRVSRLEKKIDRYLRNVGKTLKILPYKYQIKARCLISKTVEELEMLAQRHHNLPSTSSS